MTIHTDTTSTNDAPRNLLTQLFVLIDNGAKFNDVICFIDDHFEYTPTQFTNGDIVNPRGINENCAKIFGFAKLYHLSQPDTLRLFCEYFTEILTTPSSTTHPNIRNFYHWGWQAFLMTNNPLTAKISH